MNVALAIICAFGLLSIALGLRARRGHDMDLEGWSVGARGFGTIFIFLLMAGEIYSTFTFLGGAGFVYGSGGAAYYILGYGTIAYILSYWLLPAVWRYATPRKLLSQADFFVAKFDSRGLGVLVSIVAVAAMIPYLALQLKGLGIIVSQTSSGSVSATAAVWIGALVLSVYVVASGIHGSAWTAAIKDVLTLSVVLFIGLYLPIHYFGSIGEMFHRVQDAKPGFAALSDDQLTPVWFSSTVLLTALGFYMWPHTFGSALTARDEDVFRRNAIFMPLYQLLIAFVLLVGFVAVLRLPGLSEDSSDLALIGVSQRAFPDWFVGVIGSAGMLCALVPGSMLLIVSATTVARNIYRGLNPEASDETVTTLTKVLVPVIALGAVAFVFSGGQTIVTLLLLGYALVTQLFPALLASLVRPGWATRHGAIAGIVAGVGVVAAMTFSGATPGSSTTLDSLVGGLPGFLAQLNLGIVALAVNVAVTALVSAMTRPADAPAGRADEPRFARAGVTGAPAAGYSSVPERPRR
jgi:SSS family solute:Na+ symporter